MRKQPEKLESVSEAHAAAHIQSQFQKAAQRGEQRPQRSEDAAQAVCPPPTNRGGKSDLWSPEHVDLVLDGGEIKQVPKRRGYGGDTAFIDWVNFTVGEESIGGGKDATTYRLEWDGEEIIEVEEGTGRECPVTPEQVMLCISNRMHHIFGFGITSKNEKGANFYKESWNLGDNWGMVCYGGQRGTILVTLNGSGCAAAREGWENRLKTYLEQTERARITRLDLAHDDYEGRTYTVDRADQDHTDGLFNCGGRNPDCEYRGNWKSPNGKGRTFNIGNRSNGKFCRVYEKGRQLGDEKSDWVRIEVEFKSCDRLIPFDALVRPGEYLAASYPAFSWISERQERIYTTQRVVEANVERTIKWLRHQCGASVGALVDLLGVDGFLERVRRDGLPKWTKVPNFLLSPEPMGEKPFGISLDHAAATVAF